MGKVTHADQGSRYTRAEFTGDSTHTIGGVSDLNVIRTATLVVAASDASISCKAMADEVCDGTADDVQIQAAIDALPSGGGRVVLSEGTFTLASPVVLPDNTVLEGQGWASVLVKTSGASLVYIQNEKLDTGGAADYNENITVRHLTLDGNSEGNATYPIYFRHVHRVTIKGNYIFDGCGNNIRVNIVGSTLSNRYVSITDNIILNNTGARQQGISVSADDMVIKGNMLYYCNEGIDFNYGVRAVISNNVVEDADTECIDVNNTTDADVVVSNNFLRGDSSKSGDGISANNAKAIISGNWIVRCGYGIRNITGTNKQVISGNRIESCKEFGIDLGDADECIISNNIIDTVSGGTTPDGIKIEAGLYNVISGNKITTTRRAIQGGGVCAHTTVVGNEIRTCTSHAINFSTGGNQLINSNNIEGATTSGVSCAGANNVIVGNNIYNCTNSGVSGALTDSIIEGNRCDSCGVGILETAGADWNLIKGNNVRNNTTAITKVGANTKIDGNMGYVTENSGSATLLNANTTIAVAHGCDATPTVILITFAENPDNAIGDWWVDTVGATNFTFNGVDPGASNLDFYWEAKVR